MGSLAPVKADGRLPRAVASAQREAADVGFGARMHVARKALAQDLTQNSAASLATLRLSRGLSQQQLAQAIGTSQPHIARIEAGKGELYFDTAVRLADALDVSLDDLRPLIQAARASQAR